MDDRNGNLYATPEAALAAGVPAAHIQRLGPEDVDERDGLLTIQSGPFKGRVYRRLNGQLVRVAPQPVPV